MKYKINDEVFWNDPACVRNVKNYPSSTHVTISQFECCCGYGKVTEVNGEIYSIKKEDGGELEAYEHELE